MSNQVYANATTKYFTYPGINVYEPPVDQVVTGISDVAFQPVFEQQKTIVTYAADDFTFQEEGIYAITLNMGMFPTPPSAAYGFVVSVYIRSSDDRNGFICIHNRSFEPAASVSPVRLVNGSFTGWFQQGDIVFVNFSNTGAVPITIEKDITTLSISRIY